MDPAQAAPANTTATAKAEDAASTGAAIQIAVTAGLTTTVRMTPPAPVPLIWSVNAALAFRGGCHPVECKCSVH